MERKLKKFLHNGKFENVPKKRSLTMAAIRGKHNRSTDMRLRMALVQKGIRGWQLHAKELPGKPDFYFKDNKFAVFVDGCYWHGCPKCGHIPNTRSLFWKEKIKRNRQRDKRVITELKKNGIFSMRFWEHELKVPHALQKTLAKIMTHIKRKTS